MSKPSKYGENGPHWEYIVEVGYYVVGVVQNEIYATVRQDDTC